MFSLKSLLLSCVSFLGIHACAEPSLLPGLGAKVYKLKSEVHELNGAALPGVPKPGFCDKVIKPSLVKQDGKDVFKMKAQGYVFDNISNPGEKNGNCMLSTESSVSTSRGADATHFVLVNGEDCSNGEVGMGSLRESIDLKGQEIVYRNEAVRKVGNAWETDPSKENYTCTWSAAAAK